MKKINTCDGQFQSRLLKKRIYGGESGDKFYLNQDAM